MKTISGRSAITIAILCVLMITLIPGCIPLQTRVLGSYVGFSSKLPELDFTFEYPRGWKEDLTQDRSTMGLDIEVYDIIVWIDN